MSTTKEINQPSRQAHKKIISSLVFNMLVPWVIYILLRHLFDNDATPLAISTAIPVIRNLVLWVSHRKTDWIGVLSIFSFVIALVASFLTGGSPLPLKLIHPIVFGIFGLALVISVLLKRPLMMTIVMALKHADREGFNNLAVRKKFTIMSTLFGSISLVGSAIHIIMALTLPTSTYLATSHVVSWVTIFVLVVSGKLITRGTK